MNSSINRRTTTPGREGSPLLVLLLLALFIRGGILFPSLSSFDEDPDDYARLADNWSSRGVFGKGDQATAFRPPLYPWTLKEIKFLQDRERGSKTGAPDSSFLSKLALSRNASVALWHWILGIATVLTVYRLALTCSLSPRLAALAGLLVAIDPILLWQSRFVMTETLATFFSAVLLLATVSCVRNRTSKWSGAYFALLGAIFGLSTLCRPTFFAFAGLVLMGFIWVDAKELFRAKRDKDANPQRFAALGSAVRVFLFLLGLGVVVGPWVLRNWREFERPIATTTHGGYTLHLANNPELYSHYREAPRTPWNPDKFHRLRAIELEEALASAGVVPGSKEAELFQDAWHKEKARKTVAENPRVFALACLERTKELWRLVPNEAPGAQNRTRSQKARLAVGVFYGIEFFLALLGVVGVVRKPKRFNDGCAKFAETPFLWGAALILSVQTPHLIYWTNMRMRAPLEPFIAILAVCGLSLIVGNRLNPPKNALDR
ncbi:MAG: glycosyltransferase family 39 protein [Thermoguttaceae bacterium]|nr:glycosyltransferase family 39 protein [Thermoguttaceae bacterium]